MPPPIGHNSRRTPAPSRLGLVCDDPLLPAKRVAARLLCAMLRRGHGYGVKGPTWRQGPQQRPPTRPRDVKAAARKLVKRLRKHAAGDPELLRIATALSRCNRRHRCLHPACPQCGRALQRLLVRIIARFLKAHANLGPWRVLSLILSARPGATENEFAEAWDHYAPLLQEAGLTRGVFGFDWSFNEDDRRSIADAERFEPHPCVHLYGLAPAAEVKAVVPRLKRLVPATDAVRRPVRSTFFNGDLAAVAYSFKPDFVRRQTILQDKVGRANPVRNTRDRPLTVEQQIRLVQALGRAGLNGRIMLLGLSMEAIA
ncbi:hypothetical protein [Methylorubrum aminovorans]|uniref:hypothetical protein n=1 Tax=Methylorubrum aminovorans TaxID=269069 RepID=UPI003C2D5C2D